MKPTASSSREVLWTPAFGERLTRLFRSIGSLKEAAEVTGVTAETLANWRDGKARPGLFACATLCLISDLSLDWLVYGEAPRPGGGRGPEALQPSELDHDILSHVLQAVMDESEHQGVRLTSEKLAKIALVVAHSVRHQHSQLDQPVEALIDPLYLRKIIEIAKN